MDVLALVLLTVAAVGYAVVGGAGLGLGMLLPWLARGDGERRQAGAVLAPLLRAGRGWFGLLALVALGWPGLWPVLALVAAGEVLRGVGLRGVGLWGVRVRGVGLRGVGGPGGPWGVGGWVFGVGVVGSWVAALGWAWGLASLLITGSARPGGGLLVAFTALAVVLLVLAHGLAVGVRRLTGAPFQRVRLLVGREPGAALPALTTGALAVLPPVAVACPPASGHPEAGVAGGVRAALGARARARGCRGRLRGTPRGRRGCRTTTGVAGVATGGGREWGRRSPRLVSGRHAVVTAAGGHRPEESTVQSKSPTRTPQAPPSPAPPRSSVFERLAGFSHRHRWTALFLWVVVLVGTVGVAGAIGDDYRDDHSLPGTEAQRAYELLREHAPDEAGDTLSIVLHDPAGLDGAGTGERVDGMLAEVAELPGVAGVRSPYDGGGAISEDGTVGFATVVLEGSSEELSAAETEDILQAAQSIADRTDAAGEGLRVELGGDAARQLAESEGGAAEGIGILTALVILVFMFGTVIAAGLPVVVALFAVGSTIGLIIVASHAVTIASYTPYVMMLVGLGVGIDYALLIFARYRGELVKGAEPEAATRRALDAAGRTVFFAGCTVIVALLGLVALGLGSLQGVALAVALTVAVTMAASLTLLPALLGVFGRRFARQFVARAARREEQGKAADGTRWRRIGAAVQRRPLVALLVTVIGLGALAVPAADMRLGFADAGNDPAASTSRAAYDLLAEGFGPGSNGPLIIAVEGGDEGAEAAGAAAVGTLESTPGVASATGPFPTGSADVATVIVYPVSAPQDEETSELVRALRGEVLPALAAGTGAEYLVGGSTAAVEDFSTRVEERMPLFVLIVVGLSLVLLTLVFRSLLVPVKAALLNLLTIGAALGAVTLVFQHGWFGVEPGPIEAFVPVMIFAIVFGLSTDYEVFLVSRIHEEWRRTGDHALAVREGLAHTGSVITAAGAIMVAVFGAFMLSDDRMLQQFGLGLAVAVFVDAVFIRCLVVPATMQLLGRRAWWLPAPLARRLPEVELERH